MTMRYTNLRFIIIIIIIIISKTDAARIAKLDIEIFHDELWKLIYVVVRRSKVKVMNQIAHTLLA